MIQAPGSHPVTVTPATSVKNSLQNRWEENWGDSISLRNKKILITGYIHRCTSLHFHETKKKKPKNHP